MKSYIKQAFKYFLSGFFTLLPLAVTVYLVVLIFRFSMDFLRQVFFFLPQSSEGMRLFSAVGGAALTFCLVALVGLFVKTFIGKGLIRIVESLIATVPGVGKVYKAIRQVIDLFSGNMDKSVLKPVLVEYLGPGTYGIAFMTGDAERVLTPDNSETYAKVYIPTTPNPTNGYFCVVPKAKIYPLNMPMDEAMKLILTGGIAIK
jgi:uncharacterized membrane protein